MVNIQLDQLKKFLKEIPLPLSRVFQKIPEELECFGFTLSDLDLSFKKSQVQISTYFKDVDVDSLDQSVCDNFHEELNKHHNEFIDKLN